MIIKKQVSVLLTILLIFQIINGAFLFVPSPKQAQATNQTWPVTTAGNYTYDDTKIESSVIKKPSVMIMAQIAKALGASIEDLIR